MKNTQKKKKGQPCLPVSQTTLENYILRIRRLSGPQYVKPVHDAYGFEELCPHDDGAPVARMAGTRTSAG